MTNLGGGIQLNLIYKSQSLGTDDQVNFSISPFLLMDMSNLCYFRQDTPGTSRFITISTLRMLNERAEIKTLWLT